MLKKHILVVSQVFYPEPFRINDMCREWVKRGYKVTVLTGIPNYPQGKFYPGYGWFHKRREEWEGVSIHRIPLLPRGHSKIGLILNYFSFVISGFFWKLFTHLRADCVFIFGVSPMTQALPAVWYAKRRKIPCTLYVQDLWPDNVEIVAGIHNQMILKPIDHMVNSIYEKCDLILATSPSFVSVIQQRVSGREERVVYWPQYAEEFYQPHPRRPVAEIPDNGSFKIVFTGNIGQAQGLDILPSTAQRLQAMAGALARPIQFVIVGDGRYKAQLLQEIEEKGVRELFVLVDRQPAERIPELLAACDAAFVSFMDNPLFAHTIPAKLQSYMACAMPIVAAATGETARIVEEAECGVCCPTGDSEALASIIVRLANELDLTQCSANARRYFEAHFDKQMLLDQFEQIAASAYGADISAY